jgi:hypothetical protein
VQEDTETTTNSTTQAAVEFPEHGSTVPTPNGVEQIVHDTDENGNVIGWHKEAVTGNGQ